MAKSRRIRLTAILAFIAGIISLALGLYVSWKFSILPGAVVGSAIVILAIWRFLSRLKIRVEIEETLLTWGLILILTAMAICVATAVVVLFKTIPQVMPVTILVLSVFVGLLIIITKQKQFYLFIIFVEVSYIVFSSNIFTDLRLYIASNILLTVVITIILMNIVTKQCGRLINFASLLKEFIIEPYSKADVWQKFTTPFMLILISALTIQNLVPLSSFDAVVRLSLVLVQAIYVIIAVAVKMYKECYADRLIIATVVIIFIVTQLTYTLLIFHGWKEPYLESLRDLEPILVVSFAYITLFLHTPMICLLVNKNKCAKLS